MNTLDAPPTSWWQRWSRRLTSLDTDDWQRIALATASVLMGLSMLAWAVQLAWSAATAMVTMVLGLVS